MTKTYTSDNLIVGVTYYTNRINSVKKCCSDYEKIFDAYIKYLNEMKDTAIVSGETAKALAEFIKQVESLKGDIEEIGKRYAKNIESFLKDIDTADDKLFKNKGRKILTEKEFNNAVAVAKIEFSISRFFKSIFFVDLIFKKTSEELSDKESKMAQRVKDLNQYTRKELGKIQTNCKIVDAKYNRRLRNIYKELYYYKTVINKITDILAIEGNSITSENVANLRKYIEYIKKFKKSVKLDPECSIIADEDVKMFADNIDNYFEKSVDQILGIRDSAISAMLLTDFEKYRTTLNNARDYFNKFSKEYVQSKEKFDAAKAKVDKLFSLYKKYGKDFKKYCENSKEAEIFDKIISKAGDLSKKSDKYIDIWYQLFFDMSESQEALQRFKGNCDMSNENVRKAIERLEALYDKNVDAYLNDTIETYEKMLIEKGKSAAADALVEYLKSKNKLVGFLGEKVINQIFAEIPAMAECEWVETTAKALNSAINNLRNTPQDSPEFKERVKSVREAFNAAKQAQLKFFKAMKAVAKTDDEEEYYQYCYDTVNNASMDDYAKLDFEYKSSYDNSYFNPFTDLELNF